MGVIEFAAFWVLAIAASQLPETREAWRRKPLEDWLIDLVGLAVQGVAVPVLQVVVLVTVLDSIAPSMSRSIHIPAVAGFALSFVVVDYLYYWNHRLLHGPLWDLHQVHHSAMAMDLAATSRNTLWTTAFIVYLWAGGLAWWALADPRPYLLGASMTAALDLWRHTPLHPPPAIARWLSPWLILPDDHARHHAEHVPRGNYGANLKLWDQLHGTWLPTAPLPQVGRSTGLDWQRALFWPRP